MEDLKDITYLDRDNLPSNCGVYYLLNNNKVVYIGQSINLNARPFHHPNKKYNKVLVDFCNEIDLNGKEIEAIIKHKPIYNIRNGNPKAKDRPGRKPVEDKKSAYTIYVRGSVVKKNGGKDKMLNKIYKSIGQD